VKIIITGSSRELDVVSKSVAPDNNQGLPSGITLEFNSSEEMVKYNLCTNAEDGHDVLSLKNTVTDLIEHLKVADNVYRIVL
jgi:urease gamma subunit